MFFSIAAVEVGEHLYWNIAGLTVHGQVLLVTWLVIAIILTITVLGTSNLEQVPKGLQNFVEAVFEYVAGIAKDQLGEYEYRPWVPFVGTIFLFIFVSNWLGALVPWKLIHLPEGELAAPTNDINTTVALSLLTSLSYFYAGFKAKGLGFFARYISPTPIFLPINIMEDFSHSRASLKYNSKSKIKSKLHRSNLTFFVALDVTVACDMNKCNKYVFELKLDVKDIYKISKKSNNELFDLMFDISK